MSTESDNPFLKPECKNKVAVGSSAVGQVFEVLTNVGSGVAGTVIGFGLFAAGAEANPGPKPTSVPKSPTPTVTPTPSATSTPFPEHHPISDLLHNPIFLLVSAGFLLLILLLAVFAIARQQCRNGCKDVKEQQLLLN